MKKHIKQRREKINSLYKPRGCIFFVFLVLTIMAISTISAFEIDNKKVYDAQTKTVTIKNSFFGISTSKIASIKLNTPLSVRVLPGYQKVAEFEINNYGNYEGLIKQIETFDIKNNLKEFAKQIDLKYLSYEEILVDDYEKVCELVSNQTGSFEECELIKSGSHIENKELWIDFDKDDILEEGKITIGLFTHVKEGDSVEWIPEFAGVKVDEWANWTADLNENIHAYYRLNETSGTNVHNIIDPTTNGTNSGGSWTTGKIGNQWDGGDSANANHINLSQALLPATGDFSMWFWMTSYTYGIYSFPIIYQYDGSTVFQLWVRRSNAVDYPRGLVLSNSSGNIANTYPTNLIADNTQYFIGLRREGSNFTIYYNGNPVASGISSETLNSGFTTIGTDNAGHYGFKIDELYITYEALPDSSFVQGYNEGNGMTYNGELPPVVNITYPLNMNYTSYAIDLNYTVNDLTDSCWYSKDAGVTNSSYVAAGTNWTGVSASEGNNTWFVYCNNSYGIGEDNITFAVDTTSPLIYFTELGTIDYQIKNTNLTINWTLDELNLDTCILEYAGTNRTVTCTNNGTYINTTLYSNKNVTLWANDSVGNSNSSSMSWDYNVFQNSVNYSASTIEGATETFILNFSKASSLQVSTINLNYNGTDHSSTVSSGTGEVIATNNLLIQDTSTATNFSFFWNITFTDATIINTTSYNQSVSAITIDDCSANTNLIQNYSLYDEETKSSLGNNTSIEIQINLYDAERTLIISNYSALFNNTNPAQICLSTSLFNTTEYSIDSTAKYSANVTNVSNYATEYYNILNYTLKNTTAQNNIALYDLKSGDSTEFQLTFKDSSLSLAPDIIVLVYRQYVSDNDFKIVEAPITDSNGQTVLHLVRNNVIYNFIMKDASGNIVAAFNKLTAFCQDYTIGSCSIDLDAVSGLTTIYNRDDDLGISYSQTYSNSTGIITFSYVSDDLSTKTIRVDVIRNNDFGNRTVCSNSLVAASGTITCNVSNISATDRFLFSNIYVDGNQKATEPIDLEASTGTTDIITGSFISFLLILLVVSFTMEDKKLTVLGVVIGFVVCIAFGLIRGALFGLGAAGGWLLLSAFLIFWKLKKEEAG